MSIFLTYLIHIAFARFCRTMNVSSGLNKIAGSITPVRNVFWTV